MIFDEKLLKKLEHLAMIKIDEDRKDVVAKELSEITAFMDNIASIPTDAIQVTYQQNTPLREDIVVDSEIAHDVLKNAPNKRDGYFIVPKIIE